MTNRIKNIDNNQSKVKVSVVAAAPLEKDNKRITRGNGLTIVGGDKDQHDKMVEICIKTDESLSAKGKSRESINPNEFREAFAEVIDKVLGQ